MQSLQKMSRYFQNKKREELTQNEILNVTNRFLEADTEHKRRLKRHTFEFCQLLAIVKDHMDDLNDLDTLATQITIVSLDRSADGHPGDAEKEIAKDLAERPQIMPYAKFRDIFKEELSVDHDKKERGRS